MSTHLRVQAQRRRLLAPAVPVGGLILLLLLTLGSTFPYFEAIRSANELPRLMQGIALVDDHSWSIDGPRKRGLDPGPDVSRGEDGALYPNKPPLLSMVAAVGYGLARLTSPDDPSLRWCMLWARSLAALVPTLVLCAWAWRRYAGREGAEATLLAVVLYAVATPAASYSHLLYSHQLAACLAAIGTGLLLDGLHEGRVQRAAWGGFLAAASVVAEYQAVVLALPLALAGLLSLRQAAARGPALVGLAATSLVIAGLAGYHQTVFGSVWATGYHHAQTSEFAAKHAVGILGLSYPTGDGVVTHILSPRQGLCWWVPLFPLALYGLLQLSLTRGSRAVEARVLLTFFVVLLVLGCGLSFEGGWRVGPRYLVVAFPALILGWAHAFRQIRTSWIAMSIVMFVGLWSALQNSLAATLWPHIDATNVYYPLAEVLVPLFRADYQPYNLVWALGGSWGVWLAVGVGSIGVALAVFRASEMGIRMTCAGSLAIIAALYGVGLSPTLAPAHPNAAANLAYIRSVYEPRLTETVAGPSRTIVHPR